MIMTGEVTTAMLEDLKSTNRGRQFMQWIERGRVAASKRSNWLVREQVTPKKKPSLFHLFQQSRSSLTDESVKNGVLVSVAALDHRDGDGEDQGDNGDQGVVALPSPLSSTWFSLTSSFVSAHFFVFGHCIAFCFFFCGIIISHFMCCDFSFSFSDGLDWAYLSFVASGVYGAAVHHRCFIFTLYLYTYVYLTSKSQRQFTINISSLPASDFNCGLFCPCCSQEDMVLRQVFVMRFPIG